MEGRKSLLKFPISPTRVAQNTSVSQLVDDMGLTAFQGKNLSLASDIWKSMLKENVTILLGLAGAMVPAGMKSIITYLIENRLIDCLVSTGANLAHDCHEALGYHHWRGHESMDDSQLAEVRVNRIYDVLMSDEEFDNTYDFIKETAELLDRNLRYTTREFLYFLGKRLSEIKAEDSILAAAYKADVPIYCPAIGDSSIGLAIAEGRFEGSESCDALTFDVIGDALEIIKIVASAESTGVIYVGGGTPKNFIQQSSAMASYLYKQEDKKHKYGIQITTDAPHWGGSSGCTFEEAQSWRKFSPFGKSISVYADATIVLPILVNAIAGSRKRIKRQKFPHFKMGRELDIEQRDGG